jgi:hypothetical protein
MTDQDQKVDASNEDKTEDVNVEVKVEDDEIDIEVKDEGGDEGIPPDDGIEALKRSLEEQRKAVEQERQLRAQAEQAAYQAKLEAQNNFRQAQAATYQSLNDAIVFVKAQEENLQKAWIEAKTQGDYQREAEVQQQMMQNAQALQGLQYKKESMERAFKQGIEPVAPPQPADPIDAWANTLTPKTADWVRRNKDRLSSEEGRNLVAAAHHKALGQGLRLESEAYFEAVETELGMRRPARHVEEDDDDDGVMSAASAPAPRRSVAPPAAPVTRGGPRKGVVTLSAAEKEAAEISGVSYEEYARNKAQEAKRKR